MLKKFIFGVLKVISKSMRILMMNNFTRLIIIQIWMQSKLLNFQVRWFKVNRLNIIKSLMIRWKNRNWIEIDIHPSMCLITSLLFSFMILIYECPRYWFKVQRINFQVRWFKEKRLHYKHKWWVETVW
jgi:hypothetical protein